MNSQFSISLHKLIIRGNCLQFLKSLYFTLKGSYKCKWRTFDFPIHRGVRQVCFLSPIQFNVFVNDLHDNCDMYGITILWQKILW